jgi:hypothetical protein
MTDNVPRPDVLFELEDRSIQLRASQMTSGVWDVFDNAVFLGTLAESHSFRRDPSARYIARRSWRRTPKLVDGLHDGIQYLVHPECPAADRGRESSLFGSSIAGDPDSRGLS